MKLSEIDRNFLVQASDGGKLCWVDAEQAPICRYGLLPRGEGCYKRMPQEVADAVSPSVADLNSYPAGGRVRFRTDSRVIAIRATMPKPWFLPHFTRLGQAGFDLCRCDNGEYTYVGSFLPGEDGSYVSELKTDGKAHTYMISFPLFTRVDRLEIGLCPEAELDAPDPYKWDRPVVYYGSSITQGACASSPKNTYESLISMQLDCDHINLGWSGSAKGETRMAEYLASLDPLVMLCDYDANSPDPQHLERTHLAMYEIFRAKHPLTPYVMITHPNLRPMEETEDARARREAILRNYRIGLARKDSHLYFVDGRDLFAGGCQSCCSVEGTHPNDLGFYRMSVVIGEAVKRAIEEA